MYLCKCQPYRSEPSPSVSRLSLVVSKLFARYEDSQRPSGTLEWQVAALKGVYKSVLARMEITVICASLAYLLGWLMPPLVLLLGGNVV